jgi:hypothetical protein
MDNFYEISEDTTGKFWDIFNGKSFPIKLDFAFLGVKKQKEMIKITKLKDDLAFLLKNELLVSINEELLEAFDDDESVSILIEQELDKITYNNQNGKIKMVKPDLITFSGLVSKWGVEKVARANKVSDLYHDQQNDVEL